MGKITQSVAKKGQGKVLGVQAVKKQVGSPKKPVKNIPIIKHTKYQTARKAIEAAFLDISNAPHYIAGKSIKAKAGFKTGFNPRVTITGTGDIEIPQSTIKAGQIKSTGYSIDANNKAVLTRLKALDLADHIDWLTCGSSHLNIKERSEWRQAYLYDTYNFPVMPIQGNARTQPAKGYPCHNCGFIVRATEIQVDHYEPQAGGRFIAKTWRQLGLTAEQATGAKRRLIKGKGKLIIRPKGRVPGSYQHLMKAARVLKYTSTAEGDFLLSLFRLVDWLEPLSQKCMNSYLNLVPLCRKCNGDKSDRMKTL